MLLSLPAWLPAAVVKLRIWVFAHINGDEGLLVPGKDVGVARFRSLYAHPAARGRSEGAALSDLFWYWLAPGPEMHQEHIESGPRYDTVAKATRHFLTLSKAAVAAATRGSIARVLAEGDPARWSVVRLRDLLMPMWADFYYGLVFKEPCPPAARAMIVANATDVANALKMTGLRHMRRRAALTRYLERRLAAGELAELLPEGFTDRERAYYLQGVFFNTAIVQTSEAVAHLLMFIAQHADVQARLAAHPEDEAYLEHVLNESLRVHPLFGIAHRITDAEIDVGHAEPLPAGSVLCFNYAAFHHAGFERPTAFEPSRWEGLSAREANFMPFGAPTNRSCPAQGLVLALMRTATQDLVSRYDLHSTAAHTRALPNRGPCLLRPRSAAPLTRRQRRALAMMRLRDAWEDVGRSLVQLCLGTVMVIEAKRLKLCQTYFNGQSGGGEPPPPPTPSPARCPFARFRRPSHG